MARVIERGYSWESGTKMIPSVDLISQPSFVYASSTAAKTGTYSLRTTQNSASGAWRVPFPTSNADPAASLWLYNSGGYSADRLWITLVTDGGDDIKFEWVSATHTFDAYVGSSKVATGTVEVSANDWFHVQIYVVLDNSGYIGVKIDGILSIDYSGELPTTTGTYLQFTQDYGLGAQCIFYVDDLVLGHGDFLGVLYCEDHFPVSDDNVDFTPSTGSDNYATIDEIPGSTTDYNYSRTDADLDELGISDYDPTDKVIVLVNPWIYSQDYDANGSGIKVGMNSNGTVVETEYTQSAAYEWYWHDGEELNPDDSGQWEEADIDALLLRYKSVISS